MADAPPSSHDTNASGPITGSNAHRVWLWLVGTLWVAFVLWFGVDLVLHRQFQVDEFQNATNITFLSGMRGQNWATSAAPWQVWLTPVALAFRTDTESIMHALRAVFGAILVLNLLLLVWAEPHFRSPWGRMAVLWLGTLTDIFWRYGFEIRHDALILTVQLLTYGIAQRIVRSPGTSKRLYGAAGFLLTLMALSTIKGAVYAVLYTLLLVVIANPLDPWRVWRGRLAPALWYLLGACCAVLGVVVTLWLSGSASMYLHWLTTSSDAVTGLDTFSIIRWLHRPPPLTVGLSALVFYFAWRDIQRTRGQAITTSMV
ncbi:MAG: hypothetical protein KC417_10060, partial [Myxococcales bacterium]|nr:hypothetical protein [Myxococcales bacterium]